MTRSREGSMGVLPQPGARALEHSDAVRALIRRTIDAAGGWIAFSDYMQLALYAPGLGYYAAGATKFGESGDFVTAPELSPVFARACASQFDRVFEALGGGSLLELGPGTGRFALDVLNDFLARGTPLSRYALLETSPELRARQRSLLAAADVDSETALWLDCLPEGHEGVVFANEVLDALPCERFVIRAGEFWRIGVRHDSQGGFLWEARPARGDVVGDDAFCEQAERLRASLTSAAIELSDGYVGEWQRDLAAWVRALAASLRRGAVLLADYGLPRTQLLHPQRLEGTLRCHYRHRAHADPFLWPGLTDLTAWVDFTTVAEAADTAGLAVSGFTSQAAFILGSGVGATPAEAAGLRRLLLPGEMGESVKFIWLSRELEVGLPAFALQDLRDSL